MTPMPESQSSAAIEPLAPSELMQLRDGEEVRRICCGRIFNVIGGSRFHTGLVYVEFPDDGARPIFSSAAHEWEPWGLTAERLRPRPILVGQTYQAEDGTETGSIVRVERVRPDGCYVLSWPTGNVTINDEAYIRANFRLVSDPAPKPGVRKGQTWRGENATLVVEEHAGGIFWHVVWSHGTRRVMSADAILGMEFVSEGEEPKPWDPTAQLLREEGTGLLWKAVYDPLPLGDEDEYDLEGYGHQGKRSGVLESQVRKDFAPAPPMVGAIGQRWRDRHHGSEAIITGFGTHCANRWEMEHEGERWACVLDGDLERLYELVEEPTPEDIPGEILTNAIAAHRKAEEGAAKLAADALTEPKPFRWMPGFYYRHRDTDRWYRLEWWDNADGIRFAFTDDEEDSEFTLAPDRAQELFDFDDERETAPEGE